MESLILFDQTVLEMFYAIRDLRISYALIWTSELGRTLTVMGLAIAILLFLLLKRHVAAATAVAASMTTSGVGILFTKGLVARERPDALYQAYLETWHSFPSAHAALAMALYGILAYLALRYISQSILRWTVVLLCAAIVIIVSFSRIYLGVHYLSDVIAGLFLGAFAVFCGIWLMRRLQKV